MSTICYTRASSSQTDEVWASGVGQENNVLVVEWGNQVGKDKPPQSLSISMLLVLHLAVHYRFFDGTWRRLSMSLHDFWSLLLVSLSAHRPDFGASIMVQSTPITKQDSSIENTSQEPKLLRSSPAISVPLFPVGPIKQMIFRLSE
jgi:hypothetical protein